MAELIKQWDDGENLTVTYTGSGNGQAVFTSDTNESIDKEMSVSLIDASRNIVVDIVVQQEGLREVFMASDGDFILADGGTFNVMKKR